MQALIYEERFKQMILENADSLPKEIEEVERRLEASKFLYRNKPFTLYPRIAVLSSEARESIRHDSEAYLNILEKVLQLYEKDENVREFFMLDELAQQLVQINPGYQRKIRVSRFDTYLVPGNDLFKILENNTDCPAGVVFTGRVVDVMKQIPSLHSFLLKLPALHEEGIHSSKAFIDTMRDTYSEFSDGQKLTSIAILQVRDRASAEVLEMVQLFGEEGIQAIVADPRDLNYQDGILQAGDVRLQLVWNKINTADFLPLMKDFDDLAQYLQACRDLAVCHVNSFQARFITESKLCMAFLSEPEFRVHFTAEELTVIDRHVPWARKLTNRTVEYQGQEWNLIELVIEKREHFVLKTSYDIRGDGVVLGVQTAPDAWAELLQNCLGKEFILQERVAAPEIEVPVDDCRDFKMKKFSADFFMFNGRFQGFGSKLSDELKVNVFQGGSKQTILAVRG